LNFEEPVIGLVDFITTIAGTPQGP